ncbi:MAG: type II secretion system F family protein [Gemmatimonadota bacterium]|jgi:tight adherence protein B
MVNLTSNELLLAVAAFVAVAFGTLALFLTWEGVVDWNRRRGLRARLEADERRLANMTETKASAVLKPREGEQTSRLDRVVASMPRMGDIAATLERARVSWTPGMFLLLTIGIGSAVGLLGWALGGWLVGLAGLVIGGSLPRMWVSRRRIVRMRKFEEEFPEAVDLLARATRAGHPFSSGIAMVGTEGPPTVAEEFHQIAEEHKYGMSLEDALWGLVDRVELMDVRIFATAVLIQREVGGNLAEILDKIGETMRSRFAIRRQLRVYTAQGRMSGYVLAVLPIVMAVALFLLDREYASMLWEHWLGRILVGFAVTLQIVGYLWIRRIVDIEI